MDLNLFKTGIILVSTKDQVLQLDLINDAALKIFGWDKNTLALNFAELKKLDPALVDFTKALVDLQTSRREFTLNNQNYSLSINQLQSNSYLLEIYPVIYQDLKQTTHELKRPIQNIKTLVETLMLGAKDDIGKRDEYLDKLNFEADRLGAMVQDLLSLNRLLNKDLALNKQTIKVAELVDKLLVSASTRANNLNLKLVNELQGDLTVEADPKLLEHLLANLIDNAIKYNKEDGSVIVGFAKGLFVQDTGLGIAKADQAKVFEQFYRTSTTSHIQGTGLGLSIVKAIVDLHDWQMEIQSSEVGTRFVIAL